MDSLEKISSAQMFSVLFLCRIISLFTFMLPSTSYLTSGDLIISSVSILLFELIYSVIVIFTLDKNKNRGLIPSASDFSQGTAKLLAVLYTLSFIWFAGIGTARFELFISTVMFPNSELHLMTVLLLAAALYAALKGIEAIGRTSVILLSLLGISIIFILLSVTGEFEYTNLKPIFTQGISPILNFSFYVSVRAPELLTLYVAAPVINGNIKKMTVKWLFLFLVIPTVVFTVLAGVTGEYGDDQIFPLYTLTVIAKLGILERLDDILTGLWVLCSFIQVAYLLNISITALKQGFGKIKKIPVGIALTTGVFLVYLLTSDTVTVFSEILSSKAVDIIFLLLIAAIPLFVTAADHIGKRRKI